MLSRATKKLTDWLTDWTQYLPAGMPLAHILHVPSCHVFRSNAAQIKNEHEAIDLYILISTREPKHRRRRTHLLGDREQLAIFLCHSWLQKPYFCIKIIPDHSSINTHSMAEKSVIERNNKTGTEQIYHQQIWWTPGRAW